jgi:hypothetical protein
LKYENTIDVVPSELRSQPSKAATMFCPLEYVN